MKAFFWSDLNFADDETCYLDQCENDPCDGRGCKSTWDGKKAGFICECKFKISLLTRNYINSLISIFFCHIDKLLNKYQYNQQNLLIIDRRILNCNRIQYSIPYTKPMNLEISSSPPWTVLILFTFDNIRVFRTV